MKLNLGCGKDLRKGFLNLDKKDIDLEKPLPFATNEVEEIVLRNVIEHVVEHKQLLQECYRVLKPNGKMFISTANYCSLGHRIRFCFGNDVPFRDFNHVRFFSYKMFLEEIFKTGFVIERIKGNSLTFSFLPARYSGNVQLFLKK